MSVTRLPSTGIAAPDGNTFPWGPIQHIHEIGDIQIVEYLDDRSNFREKDQDGHGRTMFHAYIGKRDAARSFYSLDSAIVGAICYKRRGPNAQAAEYFDLMTLGELPDGN